MQLAIPKSLEVKRAFVEGRLHIKESWLTADQLNGRNRKEINWSELIRFIWKENVLALMELATGKLRILFEGTTGAFGRKRKPLGTNGSLGLGLELGLGLVDVMSLFL